MTEEEQKEMMDMEELLDNKTELLEKDPEFIDDEEEVSAQPSLIESQNDEYISIYSGRALKADELFQFSIKEDVNMVLVAGPFASGKTTLIVMLYRLFLKGLNKMEYFAGSNTMEGFRERYANLLNKSGQAEPFVPRTSIAARDWYLHLAVLDAEKRRQNMFFADVSGEIFSDSSGVEMMSEYFSDSENVIVAIDGEKLCIPAERRGAIYETNLLLKRLLNHKILSKKTKLQIIYTKMDKIEKIDNGGKKETLMKYLQEKEKTFVSKFEPYVHSVKCIYLAAMDEKQEEVEKLEQILLNCMEEVSVDCGMDLQVGEYKVIRNFDRFQVRECGQYV